MSLDLSGVASRIVAIDHIDDPRIAGFRDIRERDRVRAGGLVAEGTVVVEALLRSASFRPTALLVLRNRLAGIRGLIGRVPDSVPIHVVEAAVMDGIVGFPMHRGVLALGAPRAAAEEAVPLDARLRTVAAARGAVVVAVGIANHDNIGAIFRNAAAFGAALVLLDETSCDPLYRKAIRVSAGAVLSLPFARVATGEEAAARLAAAGIPAFALAPGGREDVSVLAGAGPAALFLGAEGPGLPAALMAGMRTLRIAMVPGFDSLNVATSAAIALHALRGGGSVPA